MSRAACVALFLCALLGPAAAAEPLKVPIGYLVRPETIETISLLDQPAANNGIAGAQLAVQDNNTTGRFLNQSFSLETIRLAGEADPATAVAQLADRGVSFVLADLSAEVLLKAADVGRERGLIFFNVAAIDDRLRQEDCRADIIHVAPSRAMLADGLGQYLAWKHWRRWLLVLGSHEPDKLYAAAFRRAAVRFGAKIVQERVFEDTGGARRSDSALCRSKVKYPCSPSRHRPTTCWSPLTKARSSPPTCPTAPASRRLLLARRGLCPQVGTPRMTNGAQFNCRTASGACFHDE